MFVGGRLGAPLRAGLAKRAISAHFQPVIDLATGQVVEYEALARWEDDRGEQHLAAHFIGVAEDTGVVREVGTQILGSAVELSTRMSRTLDPLNLPRVSINVSASELADVNFADKVIDDARRCVDASGEVAVRTGRFGQRRASRLRPVEHEPPSNSGVRFALDGFGGRSANLASLREFAIDVVKLDCGLIHDAPSTNGRSVCSSAILKLAEQIGVEVIAKGIETMDQHELLLHVGCRFAQGFLYSPPLASRSCTLGAEFHFGGALAASL